VTSEVQCSLTVEVRFAWWFWPYVHALVFFCHLHGMEPDWDSLAAKIERAARVKVIA
jgi:hypothetical protein